MKLSNRQLLNSVESLNKLNSFKLPVKASFKLAKLARVVDESLKDYQKTLDNLHDRFAQKNNGERVVVDNMLQLADPDGFKKAFGELLECETELNVDKINLDALSSLELEPALLYHLDWLIEE